MKNLKLIMVIVLINFKALSESPPKVLGPIYTIKPPFPTSEELVQKALDMRKKTYTTLEDLFKNKYIKLNHIKTPPSPPFIIDKSLILTEEEYSTAILQQALRYRPETCRSVANTLLKSEGYGEVGKASKTVYSSQFSGEKESPEITVISKKFETKQGKQVASQGNKTVKSYYDSLKKTWTLDITNDYEETGKSPYSVRLGNYRRRYNFKVVGGECVLQSFETYFRPRGKNFTEKTELDFKTCLSVLPPYLREQYEDRTTIKNININRLTLSSRAVFIANFAPKCLLFLSKFSQSQSQYATKKNRKPWPKPVVR